MPRATKDSRIASDATGALASGNGSAVDRKDRVEMTLVQAQKLDGVEAVQAWRRLCRELGHMTNPEARMPRFNGLLHAVWIAASNDQT